MNEPPQKIWLQWYGDSNDVSGIGYDQPEGVTWCADSMYQNDVCYIRAGKPTPIVRELQAERDAAIARAEAAEKRITELEAAVKMALYDDGQFFTPGEDQPNPGELCELLMRAKWADRHDGWRLATPYPSWVNEDNNALIGWRPAPSEDDAQ